MARLTAKQIQFCRYIVEGKSGEKAYELAYNSKGTTATKKKEACMLLKRDDITEEIARLRKPADNYSANVAINQREEKRNIIKERIMVCINKNDDAGAARWMEILNKLDGDYVNINKNIDETQPLNNVDTATLLRLVKKEA